MNKNSTTPSINYNHNNLKSECVSPHIQRYLLIKCPCSYFCTGSYTQSPSKSQSLNLSTIDGSYFQLLRDQYPAVMSDIGSW